MTPIVWQCAECVWPLSDGMVNVTVCWPKNSDPGMKSVPSKRVVLISGTAWDIHGSLTTHGAMELGAFVAWVWNQKLGSAGDQFDKSSITAFDKCLLDSDKCVDWHTVHMHTNTCTCIQTHMQTPTPAHTHTNTCTYMHTNTQTPVDPRTHPPTHSTHCSWLTVKVT